MNESQALSSGHENIFEILFQCATTGILVADKNGQIELANPYMEDLLGCRASELIGKSLENVLLKSLDKVGFNQAKLAFSNPNSGSPRSPVRLDISNWSGVECAVEVNFTHYKAQAHDFTIAFISDISERKKVEEDLLWNKQKLNEETQALTLLNEFVNRLWNTTSLQEGIEDLLESSIKLTGAEKGHVQLYDREKKVLYITAHRGFEQEFLEYFRAVSAEYTSACGRAMKERHQIVVNDTELEWTGSMAEIARKSGIRSVQSTPLISLDGIPIGIISTYFKLPGACDELSLRRMKLYAGKGQSFIERIRMHHSIQKQNLELENKIVERTRELITSLEREKELSELKSRFVSMASHEFRSPLATISSSVSLIETYAREDQAVQRKRHIDRVKSSVQNLVTILDQFLSLDRLEHGKVEVAVEKFDLLEFAREIAEDMNSSLKTGQHLKFSYTGGREIGTEKKILKNILINLLSNAIKYSDKDIELSIHVSESVLIEVADKGIGIPEHAQVNLFSAFFRAGNVGDIQGTGLGLNIVKRYVELLGGTITFKSKCNEGTTFALVLPDKK